MATVKKTITIPAELAARVEERQGNFSAYVTEAVRRQLAADQLRTWVADDAARNGTIPQAEIDAIAAEMDAIPLP
jgi:post-segregation antitoxin (ccd killing protein)